VLTKLDSSLCCKRRLKDVVRQFRYRPFPPPIIRFGLSAKISRSDMLDSGGKPNGLPERR
jgi:hypothetical protein